MAIAIMASLVLYVACFVDNSLHIPDVILDKLSQMLCEHNLSAEHQRAEVLIRLELRLSCERVALDSCVYLAICELCYRAAKAS